MGRLSEYDHVEREALRKGISRQPDPLPRGAVVAGEQRELGSEAAELVRKSTYTPDFGTRIRGIFASEDNPIRDGFYVETIHRTGRMNPGKFYRLTDGAGRFWEYPAENVVILPGDGLTMERIRALEARLEQGVVERRPKESALARVGELEEAVAEMGARLEECREKAADLEARLHDAVGALSPDGEWAEGSPEEKG